MVRLTENWLNVCALSMVISDPKSGWRPVTNRVPRGSALGTVYPVLLESFISGLEMKQSVPAASLLMAQTSDK